MRRLGTRLKTLREARGWTQATLAEKVGVARNTIARLETSNRRPSLELLERLAKALKVRVGKLLE